MRLSVRSHEVHIAFENMAELWHDNSIVQLLQIANCVKSARSSNLLDPSGPLSKIVPLSSIEEANKEVAAQNAKSRGKKLLEQKEVVGKYAADHGTTNAIRHLPKICWIWKKVL